MATLVLKLTDAGLAAVQAASGSDPTVIESLGLTATPFDYAPTLTALPGEFKRVEVASGVASAANVTHLTAYDTSGDVWTATGFGLFLDDGTLFAVHTGAEPVMSKVGLAFALLAFDIAFEADFAANIAYGNAVFAYPAATEDIAGIIQIGTQASVDAAEDSEHDHRRAVTVKTLRKRLGDFATWVQNAIATAVGAEATARGNADNALSAAIGDEANARSGADGALGDRIDNEASARSNADNGLQDQINTKLAAANYTAEDVRNKLTSVDGAGSNVDADLLDGYQGSDYDRVVQRNLIDNGGFEVFASGKKECWGSFSIAENAYVIWNLPTPHEAWVHPVLGVSTVGGNTSIQDNTGITGIIYGGSGEPTGVRIWNADDRTVTVWIRTKGV